MLPLSDIVDQAQRSVRADAFTDPQLYRTELDRVFARSWLYVAHVSQLKGRGDFVLAQMGRDEVLACRGEDDRLRVFLNSCPDRGGRLSRQDFGTARVFVCPCHHRGYDTSGRVVTVEGAPLAQDSHSPKELIELPRVESFEGLVFACADQGAPSLDAYLGDLKWYLQVILAQAGPVRSLFQGVHRWTVETNWKFPAEQFTGDPSHQYGVHRSMGQLGFDVNFGDKRQDFVVRFKNGHGLLNMAPRNRVLMSRYQLEQRQTAKARLSPEQGELIGCLYIGTVFPNFSLVSYPGFLSIRLWQPVAPNRTEIWSWGLVADDAPPDYAHTSRCLLSRYFSPTGVLEQDDVEIWEECFRGVSGPQRGQHRISYGLPKRPLPAWAHLPGEVSGLPSEHANFGFFERWLELMSQAP